MKKYILLLLLLIGTSCSVVTPEPVDKDSEFAVNLAPTSDYVIYSDCATLPSLYMGINMLTHTKPSFMFMHMSRPALDTNEIPDHVTMVKDDAEMITKIAEINNANPKATFTFYMNDLRIAKVFSHFYSQGISADRVKAIMLTDGTGTYNAFGHFSSQDGFTKWGKSEDKYKAELAKNPAPNLVAGHFWDGTSTFFTAPAVEQNTSFWMQWPELLVSDSTDLKNYLTENSEKYKKVDPLKYYQALSKTNQQRFLTLVGLDKKWTDGEGDGTLKNQTIGDALDASPKPNIIITGTSFGSPGAIDTTDAYIAKAKAKYGDEYDYFYKGHPGWIRPLADKSIVVLPFRLPMESIIWAYGDKISIMGGYQSSLYMNAPKEMNKFFFAVSDGSSLPAPLDLMYEQGLLGEVTFIN